VRVLIVDGESLSTIQEFIIKQRGLVSARVTLTQVYSNPSDRITNRCKYCFPVPANAAICAFSMTTSDGRTITGIAKDKDQAREEYQEALDAGKSAGILEYVTDDS
jgi:Vault protein inter-alpha-trypsin domain